MREKDSFLSTEDIKMDRLFYNYDINMEEILNKLWEKKIIKKKLEIIKLKMVKFYLKKMYILFK